MSAEPLGAMSPMRLRGIGGAGREGVRDVGASVS